MSSYFFSAGDKPDTSCCLESVSPPQVPSQPGKGEVLMLKLPVFTRTTVSVHGDTCSHGCAHASAVKLAYFLRASGEDNINCQLTADLRQARAFNPARGGAEKI